MNPFKWFAGVLSKAFGYAKSHGLTDDIIKFALPYVKKAEGLAIDGVSKQAYVLEALLAQYPFIPKSVLHLAIELALQLFKHEADAVVGKL